MDERTAGGSAGRRGLGAIRVVADAARHAQAGFTPCVGVVGEAYAKP